LDTVAESLLTAVLNEQGLPREELHRNIRNHIALHEASVRSVTAVAPEVQEDAVEEFRARFRACLDQEATHATAEKSTHLREVVKIFAEEWPGR
jgi:adenylosuccinate lyase